jgi:ribosomal protein L29
MKTQEKKELQTKTIPQLIKLVEEKRMSLLSLQMEKAQGKLQDVRKISRLRDDIARILTIINQKEKESTNA